AEVRIGSGKKDRAGVVGGSIRSAARGAKITAVSTASTADGPAALAGANLVIAAGAAGVVLLPQKNRVTADHLKVAIDLNAVPPAGIEAVEPNDNATDRNSLICYGALGIGQTKMKLHKMALEKLFERNDLVFDAEQLFDMLKESEKIVTPAA